MGVPCGKAPREASQTEYQVGDRVLYIPHECHAFNCNANNEYPWVIGLKQQPRMEEDPYTGERKLVEEVREVEEGRLHRQILPAILTDPGPNHARERLVPLRPVKPWPAVVTRVHEDGSTDLDIESNVGNGMITLHYRNVPIDPTGSKHHTCRKLKGGA